MKGFRKKTDEDRASEELFDFFYENKKAKVHSWHPPDGKAYFTLLLQIPQVTTNCKSSSGRDHLDLIVQIDDTLILLEVKGKLSDSNIDIEKLNNVKRNYGLDYLLKLFEQQGAKFDTRPAKLILALAARNIDTSTPNDFAVFCAGDGIVQGTNDLAKNVLNLLL